MAADATLLEPNRPRLVRLEVPLRRLPAHFDGFTIVQLSDFHYDPHFSVVPIREAVRMCNDLFPDLVVLTGDFVSVPVFGSHKIEPATADPAELCAHLLAGLRSRFGSWAILGNHDVFSDATVVTDSLSSAGIQVLRNQAAPVEKDGARLWLAGVNDVLAAAADVDQALQGLSPDEPVILLAHEPDFADHVAKYPVDLQLSGHSHGGQVRLPLLGPLYLPELARKYPTGLRRIGPLTLYTNQGLGTLRIPVRLNCPPEVTHITLRAMRR